MRSEALPGPPTTQAPPGRLSRVVRIAARLVVPVSLGFLAVTLVRNASELPAIDWRWATPILLAIACLLQVLAIALSSVGWTVLLRGAGFSVGKLASLRVIGGTQIAKYTPGNVLQYVGRVGQIREYGVPVDAALATITLETVLLVVIAAGAGVGGLLLAGDVAGDVLETLTANALIPALALATFACVGVFAWAFSRRVRQMLYRGLGYVDGRHVAMAAPWYAVGVIALGSQVWFLQEALWSEATGSTWLRLGWASLLAWVAGFITPGAPGGIGVREAVFVAVVGPELGHGLAVGLAVAQRLASAVGDVLVFGLAWCLRTAGAPPAGVKASVTPPDATGV